MAGFGRWLARERDKHHLSAEQVVLRMERLGVALDRTTLYNYEAGTVRAPDPGVLWALARIYGLNVDWMLEILIHVRHDKDADPDDVPTVAPKELPASLDETEENLVSQIRSMPPSVRQECLDFVAFKSQQHARKKTGGRSFRAKGRRAG